MAGKPLIVILGPTGVGKTRLAIQIAQTLNGEIVGADSRQIYRHMDIGTAKPTVEEQRAAVHHLIDIVDPDENLSLAEYQKKAYAAIDRLHQQGRLPLLVGGTGQYITAVVEGWSIPEVPPNDDLRNELEVYANKHGAVALHNRLARHDPKAAEKIHPNNVRRVIRALEVFMETGEPITKLQQKKPPAYHTIQYGFDMDRNALYTRVDQRVDRMMDVGLLDEVRGLVNRGYGVELPAMSGIGYRQLVSYISGTISLEQAVTDTKLITHDFIRRQYTWFRKHARDVQWLNSLDLDIESILKLITQHLKDS